MGYPMANLKHYPILPNAFRKDSPDPSTAGGHPFGFKDSLLPALSLLLGVHRRSVEVWLWALLQVSLGQTDKAHHFGVILL